MSVMDYEVEFIQLSHYAAGLVDTELDWCLRFENRLKYKIKSRVATHRERNFDALVKIAKITEEIERLGMERRRDRDRDRFKRPSVDSSACPIKRGRGESSQRGCASARPIVSGLSAIAPPSQSGSSGLQPLLTCVHCRRCHFGECRKKLGTCFRCGYGDHFIKDYPEPAPSVQTPACTPTRTQSTVRTPTGRNIPYFALYDNGSTHSYISYSGFECLNIPVDNTENSVTVQSHVGQSIELDRIFRGCPIEIHGEIFMADLMELPLEEFDLILSMDWLKKHRVNLDYETKRTVLKTLNN
ncbi:uncharacterized protein LOC120196561 [Hibiscus syriacus]|uniref:uncharacterized protein LOC120196561 n=1 Tax=Hibiscus syriacus TaxID=106335 RepID=UPI001921C1BF|nr:uncharacterized protein LOC120196561 [Hibiscus syriacus]